MKQYLLSLSDEEKNSRLEKIKQANLKKYGVEYVFQSSLIKEKIANTNLEKYGVTNPAKNLDIKNKIKQTNLLKYGYTTSAKNEDVKAKKLKTNLERYGVNNPSKNQLIAKKISLSKMKIGYDNILKRCEYQDNIVIPLFTKEEYEGGFYDKIYKWKCNECGNEFEHYYNNGLIPICRQCHPKQFGEMQNQLLDYIESNYSGDIVVNDRKIIYPKELDIYLPDLNLAFEFNGDYWHSINNDNINSTYHLDKTIVCEEKGIKLIHIFEYQWLNNNEQIKQRILSLINKQQPKVFARKCTVKEISNKECNEFINKNHLQGSINAKVNLGLYYKNNLIGVMTFGKPRFNRNYEWELLRFCTNITVIGGAGKLLKYFENKYNPKSLISYANRCWSSKLSNVYSKIGFKLVEESKPNYVYLNHTKVITRYQSQKHKLKDLLGEDNYNPNLTEFENMKNNSYFKIYDCGNLVYIKEYSN